MRQHTIITYSYNELNEKAKKVNNLLKKFIKYLDNLECADNHRKKIIFRGVKNGKSKLFKKMGRNKYSMFLKKNELFITDI